MVRISPRNALVVTTCLVVCSIIAFGLGRSGLVSAASRSVTGLTSSAHINRAAPIQFHVSRNPAYQALAVQTDWPQYGFDASGNRFNPNETILSPANVAGLTPAWSAPLTGTGCSLCPAPIVANGNVYINDRTRVVAFNATDGTPVASFQGFTGGTLFGTGAVSGGTVFAGAGVSDSRVYAFSATTGAEQWDALANAPVESTLAVAGGVVYAGSNDHFLYAFNATTGKVAGQLQTGGEVTGAPAVANGVVYATSNDNWIYAVDTRTKAIVWKRLNPAANSSDFGNPLVVLGGRVYVAGSDPESATPVVTALDAATGTPVWTATLDPFTGSPFLAAANGRIYALEDLGNLVALDASTGNVLWSVPLANESASGAPAVANGVVYIATHRFDTGGLRAFDASTGASLWSFGPSQSGSAPTVVNGMVYAVLSGSSVGGQTALVAFHLP